MAWLSLKGPLRPEHIAVLLALLGVWLAVQPALAQTFDATTLRQPIDLGMPWLVHAGDDPAYARTDFDDSKWTVFDPNTSLKAIYPNHPEVVWYRLHARVAPNETGLALAEWNISSAFEIYVNGQKLIQTGQVAPFVPYTFDARLLKPISRCGDHHRLSDHRAARAYFKSRVEGTRSWFLLREPDPWTRARNDAGGAACHDSR